VSVVLFIIGLKGLSHPETAAKGNRTAAIGMGLGILAALLGAYRAETGEIVTEINNVIWVVVASIIGGGIGYVVAKKVELTSIPEMVSLFNGLGGASAMLIALVEFFKLSQGETLVVDGGVISTAFALFIGCISFTGSLIAYGKLNGSLRDNLKLPAPQIVNGLLLLVTIVLGIFTLMQPQLNMMYVYILLAVSLVYGVTFVIPIGGGDMPVVISLLNSFTGIGAAVAGLIYDNDVMVFGGILVGASGTLLTVLMCEAMNRSLMNVIIGGFGASGAAAGGDDGDQTVKEARHADLAIQMKYSSKVMIVPGYGLAVAQAQHICNELEQELEEEGVQVTYAIHPVAGRMPGHMNVLLAEADVEYDKLLDLEQANKDMESIDIVLVVGANDVVNPQALDDPSSSIYGMPIIDVSKAKNCIVLKRSMSAGYAGIQNPLFFKEKTRMLFGDAKASLKHLIEEMGNA
jgi:NAD(P) transhydrogenase subunit beta